MPMVGPLQAHTNVRDVLAPLFSNGRSFSSLIDELSRHFRLEQSNGSRYPSYDAYGDDPVGVLEASSESQSTDSEAEGNLSDETDSRLVQARVSAQGRSSDTVAPVAAAVVAPQGAAPSPAVEQPPLPPLPGPSATGVAEPPPAQPEALAPTRRTRSRSRRQQQPAQASPAAGGGVESPQAAKRNSTRGGGGGGISSQNGDCSGAAAAAAAAATGGGGGGVGPAATGAMPSRSGGGGAAATTRSGKSFFSGDELTVLSVTANADGWSEAVGAALATRARAGYVFAQEVDPDSQQSTEFVREMFLDESSGARKALELRRRLIPVSQKVLLCSAWVDSGEYLAAAARLVAQCHAEVFGIACVRFEQNCSTEGLVDRFNLFAKSMPKGSVPPLNMGMKSCIPASLTKGFHGYTFNSGGSRPGGPAQSASRGGSKVAGSSGAAGVDDGGGGGGGASGAVGAAGGCADGGAPAPGDDVGQDTRARKRRRSRDAPTGQNNVDAIGSFRPTTSVGGAAAAAATATATSAAPPTVVAPVAPAVASAPEPMEEDSMIPASDEVSAGEGVAEPGDGGRPAEGERFGGGALSEGERTAGVGSRSGDGVGGRGWRQLIGGAIFSEEEGDYAADSERSTDHEPVHLYGGGSGGGGGGGGGGRESDEHEMSEREVFRRSRGRSGRRGRGRSRGPAAQHGGGGGDGRAGSRPSSPETCLEADGESSSNRGSQQAASRRDGGGSKDPELDRDRASSCSSADSPNPDRRPVSCGSGNGEARGGVTGKSFDETKGRASPSAAAAAAAATQAAAAQAAAAAQPPPTSNKPSAAAAAPFNSPGGVIPWHHTSVYEANNPTEDRHAELSHDALGIKVYCVCDGHGGSRAAQFVCDNLAADVLTRVESIEAAAAPATARGRGGSDAGGGDDDRAGREAEIRVSLADAFTSCDEQFIAQLDPTKNRGYINAGCCVVLALLVRSQLFLAHVGDCRVVLGTTDAARFPPDLLSTAKNTPSPSPPSSSGKGRVGAAGGKRGASGGKGGDGGPAAGRGRCSKGGGGAATATATAGPRRVGSPLRAAGAADSELKAIALSRDHNCDDADEVALVRARSGDDNAIRASRNDEWKGARAIKRVAGSLAVTRAIGDAYLKRAVFSFSPYKEGVPYITAEPEVTVVELTSKDRFLVLASDGVWEQVSNEEAVQCVSGALASASGSMGRRQRSAASRTAAGGGGGGSGGAVPFTSDALVDFVLARSAQSHGMSVPALRALPRGSSRRMLHDDVCATVVHFTPAPPQQAPL
ncbi:conserved unknown protein [Ectocarpus siliculosus]|uniref:PPM-type phosphatase domain-containing protein n=1 Tax=Ectocarpus siliculosus TaxID=2880 RepID=D8LJY7_ECTSI|nr:conserved unknown protein [Ectocarpus siliculosus]|eukprot:CBN74456.1 conserved unknown protein [Ectocarpus siliculosus]